MIQESKDSDLPAAAEPGNPGTAPPAGKAFRIVLPLLVLAGAILVATVIVILRPKPEKKEPEVIPPLVRAAVVRPQEKDLNVRTNGTVRPRTESTLVPQVSGKIIEVSPSFAGGGFFEENEVLIKIDPTDYALALKQTEAQVAQAKHRLALEEAEAELARKEWKDFGSDQPDPLVLREPQLADARAALKAAEGAEQLAKLNLKRTLIAAPFAGRVSQKLADLGQVVAAGTPLARIYAVDYAEVRLPIPDRELAFLDLPLDYRDGEKRPHGPKVLVRAKFGGEEHKWEGRIVRTEAEIDPKTRMVTAVAQIKNPYARGKDPGRPPLSVGMFVEAEISGRKTGNVFVLPRSVMRDETHLLVVDEQDRLHFREVDVLRSERNEVTIRKGLTEGERVCLSPLDVATEGMKVRIAKEEPGK